MGIETITTRQEANVELAKKLATARESLNEAQALADKFGLTFSYQPSGMGEYVGRGEGEFARVDDDDWYDSGSWITSWC